MPQFGVKLFSNNIVENAKFAKDCINKVKQGVFDYLELMALQDNFVEVMDELKKQVKGQVKVVIHAPHYSQGMNVGDRDAYNENRKLLYPAQKMADLLDSEIIILHAGNTTDDNVSDDIEQRLMDETIRQFRLINDERIAVENLPYYCPIAKVYFSATTPKEIALIKEASGCKFCYDFCHGICASNSFARDRYDDMEAYSMLIPDMYHLCDGNWNGKIDGHKHYGEGDYDLSKILSYVKVNGLVTMETGHGIPQNITPWVSDVMVLRKLENGLKTQ